MFRYFSLVIFGCLFCAFIPGCTKDTDSSPLINPLISGETKAKLLAAADSVFLVAGTPGMIAVFAEEGQEDFIISRGFGNIETGEPMDKDQYFRIGSLTKTFTGTATLMLADDGVISLDSTISHYLPEYDIPGGNKITVRMLGNMTSGLYNYTSDAGLWTNYQASSFTHSYTADSLLAIAFGHTPAFEPGTSFQYCNTGVVLLGVLIEKMTGKSIGQVIRERIIQPLNLNHTSWPVTPNLPIPDRHGYNSDNGKITDITLRNPSWADAAGIMVSTLTDLKIWTRALGEGMLLSDKMKAERTKWIQDLYGFCLARYRSQWIGHAGTLSGYNSFALYNPDKKITVVISVNNETGGPAEKFTEAFIKILEQE